MQAIEAPPPQGRSRDRRYSVGVSR